MDNVQNCDIYMNQSSVRSAQSFGLLHFKQKTNYVYKIIYSEYLQVHLIYKQ
jgi:hypothetical protein